VKGGKYMYEKSNEAKIAQLHPKVARLAREWLAQVTAEGIPVMINQGLRTIAQQDALYAQGRTTPGSIVTQVRGGYSYHNYGLALDYNLVSGDGGMDWNNDDPRWKRAAQIGKSLGFDWGGDWTDFKDYPHLEYTFGFTTTQLRNGARLPADDDAMTAEEKAAFDALSAKVAESAKLLSDLVKNTNNVAPPDWADDSAAYYEPHMAKPQVGTYDFWRISEIQYRKEKGLNV
jgi:peptidoglycan L-alanyl-D-glutamate endopeptidase CwlK